MALPKRRQSRSRSRKRRTHWVLTAPALAECSHCGEMKRTHRVCPHCGYYHEREIKSTEEL